MKKDDLHIELTADLIDEAQRKLDIIANEGCTKSGVSDSINPNVKPDWYDEERFKRGQDLSNYHYTAAANGSVVGLLIFLQLPVGLAPLLATGKSRNLSNLFKRYFDTTQYVDEWFQSDPFDPNSKSFKTLSIVHSMHKNAGRMMNEKISVYEFAKKVLKENKPDFKDENVEKYIRNRDRVWVSQFDMALIQWSFLGCSILEPKATGLHGASRQDLEDMIYVWKVISYKLGIDSKYSLIEDSNFDLVYAMCKLVLEQEYILHMENVAAPAGVRMTEGVLLTLKDILVGLNCNVYLRYWYKVLNVNSYKLNRSKYEHSGMQLFEVSKKNQLTDEEKKAMLDNGFNDKYIVSDYSIPFEEFKLNGFRDRMIYRGYVMLVNTVLKYDWGKRFTKDMIKKALLETRKIKKEKIMQIEKIQNERFEFPECPFTNTGHKSSYQTVEYPDIYSTS